MGTTTTSTGWTRRAALWRVPDPCGEAAERLATELGVHPLAAAILVTRGFTTAEAALTFLNPSLSDMHDPARMRDMDAAVGRIWKAIEACEPILLYGDYDVDGTTSIVILKAALDQLKAPCQYHIPHRLKDGYGMRPEVIEEAAAKGIRLIISVDTGIRATAVVEHARELGIDVIVTDHHLPEAELPPAVAVLNPNRQDCDYPHKNLCGAGVTFKLIQALFKQSSLTPERQTKLLDSFLKLVAIATVADIVPLTDENRIIVKRGLAGLKDVRNPGLRALIGVSGLKTGIAPSAGQVGFRLAPRINAAGRMDSARDVIDLFSTTNEARASELAEQLDRLNRERQNAESEIIECILKACAETPVADDCAALVFAETGWHLGVVGIVASRLVERFSRPVFILSESAEEGFFSGSGRSIPGFHLLEALESMGELFHKFGGHKQAAGLTIQKERVSEFRERFDHFARQFLTADDLRPRFTVDAIASFKDLSERVITQLLGFGPYGFGNPAPILMATAVEVAGQPKLLSEGKHLRVPLTQEGRVLFLNAWNFGDRAELFTPGHTLDVLFTVEEDPGAESRGYGAWSFTLKDARISS